MDEHIYYHVTPEENLASILDKGLLPLLGARSEKLGEPAAGIFLFTSADAVENAALGWLGDEFDEDEPLALLEVRLSQPVTPTSGAEFEAVHSSVVSPDALRVLSGDLMEEEDLAAVFRHAGAKTARP